MLREKQEQMGDVPENILAYAVLIHVGLRTSQIEFPERDVYDAKSITEHEPTCFLNIPVYLIETRKVKKKDGVGQMHIAVDKEYNFFELADWNSQLDAIDDVAVRVMLHNALYTTYQGRPQLKIVKNTRVEGIQQGGFELPPPTLRFNGLKENKLLSLEGYGIPGSLRTSEKVVRLEMSDKDSNGVKVVLFSRVFDPLERTLKIPLEKLDWCKLKVVGNYVQKEDRGTYSQFDVVYALRVEVLDYYGIEEETWEKISEKPKIHEKSSKAIDDTMRGKRDTPKAQLEWLEVVLLKPLDEIEFLEKLEEEGLNAEVEMDRLRKEGIVKVEDGIVHYITDTTSEDMAYMDRDNSSMEKDTPSIRGDTTNIGKSGLAITMGEALKGLEKELQKLKDYKGVKTEEWKSETEKILHTQVEDSEFEKIVLAMSMNGIIYEPKTGRWRRV